jgi:hypothetical protein
LVRKDDGKEKVMEEEGSITEDVGKAGASVKAGIISSLKGINEIEAEIFQVLK